MIRLLFFAAINDHFSSLKMDLTKRFWNLEDFRNIGIKSVNRSIGNYQLSETKYSLQVVVFRERSVVYEGNDYARYTGLFHGGSWALVSLFSFARLLGKSLSENESRLIPQLHQTNRRFTSLAFFFFTGINRWIGYQSKKEGPGFTSQEKNNLLALMKLINNPPIPGYNQRKKM